MPFAQLTPDEERAVLRPLAKAFPTVNAALGEIARLSAELTLPKGTVHVISDVHGEHKKLRHVINNASGTLRPLVERMFAERLSPAELQRFLTLLLYPRETLEMLAPTLRSADDWREFSRVNLRRLVELVRTLSRHYTLQHALDVFPFEFRDLLQELLHESSARRGEEYTDTIIDTLVDQQRAFQVIRLTVRLVRNLAIDELIIAGDFWDRGARGDKVIDYLMRLPNVAFTWGNHDAAWIGACLGHLPCIAHVLRISLRYRRLSQLEEGYGITLQPLEKLVRDVYHDDPAECFKCKGTGLREDVDMRRMQKAAAVMQFKLEGQMIARRPEWGLDNRRLLHRMNLAAGTIQIDGRMYALKDAHFPTIDPAQPYELSADEQACIERIQQSFLTSQVLWEHIQFVVRRGSMYLLRDHHLIFHGCVSVDRHGEFLPMPIDGQSLSGKALFDAIDRVVVRAMDQPTEADRDLMWYLWCGPRSPLFGKDRITTFENDLVADAATHVETKDPYFALIHEPAFCHKILKEFGADAADGLIVNGHVPVKIEKGESPLKKSGLAITIDGAFSEAYGDHGYTLVLEPERTFLAEHYHFESVAAAVRDGVDIIPKIMDVRTWPTPHRVADTEQGDEIRNDVALLERLVAAYRNNTLRQRPPE